MSQYESISSLRRDLADDLDCSGVRRTSPCGRGTLLRRFGLVDGCIHTGAPNEPCIEADIQAGQCLDDRAVRVTSCPRGRSQFKVFDVISRMCISCSWRPEKGAKAERA